MDTEQFVIGGRKFARRGRTYVFGILNVTPDSFSDGGKWDEPSKALKRVEEMIAEGMDVLDIGGESTRPGHAVLSDAEEIERVVPVIEKVKARFDIPISLDTRKSKVASAGIAAGADFINDVSGLKYDGALAEVIAKSGLPCCLTHNREEAVYRDFPGEVLSDLRESVQLAERSGIAREKLVVDPGIGFAKTCEQSLKALGNLERLAELDCPVLLGCSRKSVIGETLGLAGDERLEGTLATTVIAVLKGCTFVRVHDIKENVRAIRMTEAILNAR